MNQNNNAVIVELTALLGEINTTPLGANFVAILNKANLSDEVKILALRVYKYYKYSKLGYHNFKHIVNVLNSISELTDGFQDSEYRYPELILAACYHDAIYVPKNNQNEWLSIMAFDKEYADIEYMGSRSGVNCWLVRELILATKVDNHLSSGTSATPEVLILMDAGLASLAFYWCDFRENQISIISENRTIEECVTEDHLFKCGEFLQQFADKDYIYRTEKGRELYETKARANIARLRDSWSHLK